ncbi:MAG: hypothetical protein AAGJ87_01755 [Pseudomonadota bacterium]
MHYAYFAITPGVELRSFVCFPDGQQGNYIKFGDTGDATPILIRKAYIIHNPDIGVPAVFSNDLGEGRALGAAIKSELLQRRFDCIPDSDWFFVEQSKAWDLCKAMRGWNGAAVGDTDYDQLVGAIVSALSIA